MAFAQTELKVPVQSILRQRLVQRILRATQFRLTMLVAGAGFGKSIAVRDFLQTHPLEHVRFNVKPDNRSLISFVRGLANAISATNPHLRLSLAGALEAAKQSTDPAKALADWLLAHLESAPTTIVIDDLHYVSIDAEVSSVSTLLRILVDQTRGKKRWIISTRSNMELPVSAWSESGAMDAPVDENDLRFTVDDARAVARLTNARLGDDEIAELLNLTDGWPAAFMLGLSTPERTSALRERTAPTHGYIYRYLAQSVLENVKPRIKKFLLETSVFPSLDGRLLENSNWKDHAAILTELGHQGGVISLTSEGAPQYPELLREFLQEELRKSGDHAYINAMRHAAQALERSGSVAQALDYHTEISSSNDVARLLQDYGFNLIESGNADTVQKSMPIAEKANEQSAAVCALRGFFEFQGGRFDTSDAWFLLGITRADTLTEKAEVTVRYCSALMHRRQTAECIELLEPYIDASDINVDLKASIYSTLGMAYVLAQRFPEARSLMARALDLLSLTDSKVLHAQIYQSASGAALFAGDVAEARRMAPMAHAAALDAGLYDVAARALSILYNIASDIDDDPNQSLEILTQIAQCALNSSNVKIRLYALTGAFLIEVERGNTEGAVALSKAINSYHVSYSDVSTSESLLPGQALMMAGNGHFAEAFRLLAPSAEHQVTEDRRAMRWSEIALYAAAASLELEANSAVRFPMEYLQGERTFNLRGVQIALNLVLSLTLLNRVDDASELLAGIGAQIANHSLRLRCLYGCVKSVFENWRGTPNHAEVISGLRALRANNLGGVALVFESLPMSLKAR